MAVKIIKKNIHVINDLFLTTEMAKALPFIKQLDLNDQISFFTGFDYVKVVPKNA
jgi:hypothetical protein